MGGSMDLDFKQTMTKFDQLSGEMEKTRKAIIDLQNVIVKLDRQNRKLQVIGLVISAVAIVDVFFRVLPLLLRSGSA